MLFYRQVDRHSFMHENLMDRNHPSQHHRRKLGSIELQLSDPTSGDGWVEARYHFERRSGRKHGDVRRMNIGGEQGETDYDVTTIRTLYAYLTLPVTARDKNRPSFP